MDLAASCGKVDLKVLEGLLALVRPFKRLPDNFKGGKHVSVALKTNLFSAATRPIKDWTSLMFFRGSMSNIAWILPGFASIPLCETMNPKNFLEETLNAHLLGFSLI